MRSLEYLIREYPDKTGKEILEIQEQDKKEDQREWEERNKASLDLIEDYNTNGAYFKSTFGLNQYRLYRFYNLEMSSEGNIYCDVETIVGFYIQEKNKPEVEFSIERRFSKYENFDKYLPQKENRITKTEFDQVINYYKESFGKFWGLIK